MNNKAIKIVALTEAGLILAKALQAQTVDSELWFKPKPFSEKVQQAFSAGCPLILICATGIAVRTLAPVLNNKHDDPPVLVLDELGDFVIPLLSGHEGGANQWASEVALQLGAQLVMTTAKSYVKAVYSVGMGCERNCTEAHLRELLETCLQQANLDLKQVGSINSIDIKYDEKGLIDLAKSIQKPYVTFDKETLSAVEDQLSVKSDYVFNTVGVYGVAESAALIAAQRAGQGKAKLLLTKQKTGKATCAIALSV